MVLIIVEKIAKGNIIVDFHIGIGPILKEVTCKFIRVLLLQILQLFVYYL